MQAARIYILFITFKQVQMKWFWGKWNKPLNKPLFMKMLIMNVIWRYNQVVCHFWGDRGKVCNKTWTKLSLTLKTLFLIFTLSILFHKSVKGFFKDPEKDIQTCLILGCWDRNADEHENSGHPLIKGTTQWVLVLCHTLLECMKSELSPEIAENDL